MYTVLYLPKLCSIFQNCALFPLIGKIEHSGFIVSMIMEFRVTVFPLMNIMASILQVNATLQVILLQVVIA